MRHTIKIALVTLVALLSMDALVAATLGWAERTGRLGALVTYFDYGRSVPGKLSQWEQAPDMPGNLYDVAWPAATVAESAARFALEDTAAGPVIRSYGMSFANRVIRSAVAQRPELIWDAHDGPGGPPNFTFALFEDDRVNRREGDIVVLGILSSSVPAMTALTNSTWVFEQPAPFTYPVYLLEGDKLARIDPVVQSSAQQRIVADDAGLRQAWQAQLSSTDAFHDMRTYGASWLDVSPFARLVRRSLATAHIERTKADVLSSNSYPYEEVLRRMIIEFAETAQADGQIPVVMLIQNNRSLQPDLLPIVLPVLERTDTPYLATAEHFDYTDRTGFVSDGHYKPEVDQMFGAAFLSVVDDATKRP